MKDVEADLQDQITRYLSNQEWNDLTDQVNRLANDPQPNTLARVFTGVPRTIRSADAGLRITFDGAVSVGSGRLPLLIKDWPLARLIRVWVLMNIPKLELSAYISLIERLFQYGEMEELAALYAALPIYHYPTEWRFRCTEGVRSNMAPVRRAVILNNSYPSHFLDEGAWNQLVLKAFFTDEDIVQIIGLKTRNNGKLAGALVDYAYELYAAKRNINPFLWILVAPFLDERAYRLMEQIIQESQQTLTRKAIAYAFETGNFAPATDFITRNSELTDLKNTAGTPWDGWLNQTE
ncbi:EboA domain-containing protein [Parapedobacter defluvii]|uniref:EboA domain-containing protein n=1 Tax=Parapedobacter defluvii TaxID=2045106 RepID=UPI0033428C33